MTNHHNGGKRLICNGCNTASPTFDKSATWGLIKRDLKQRGWSGTLRRDYCPSCTKKHEESKQ